MRSWDTRAEIREAGLRKGNMLVEKMCSLLMVLALLACVNASPSGLRLPQFFSSGMVLQRGEHGARIWGWSSCEEVSLTHKNGTVATTVDAKVDENNFWSVTLSPQQASIGHTIEITDCASKKMVLKDVLFGDVFLCSGQSNMEFSVGTARSAFLTILESGLYKHLRMWVGKTTPQDTAQLDFETRWEGGWHKSEISSFSPKVFSYPSAVCYMTARNIYKHFNGAVPIGFVGSYVGGTSVEAWSSQDALRDYTCGGLGPVGGVGSVGGLGLAGESSWLNLNNLRGWWRKPLGAFPSDFPSDFLFGASPTYLFNGMVHPLLSMRFKAVFWYQGEANSHQPDSYACRFPAMITDWRRKFGDPLLPFLFVQLAGYSPDVFADLREAQMRALQLPHVDFASAIDLGNQKDIHPHNKGEVARRLTLSALDTVYNKLPKGESKVGPTFQAFYRRGDEVIVTYFHGTARNLFARGTEDCSTCCLTSPFEMFVDNAWVKIPNWRINESRSSVTLVVGKNTSFTSIRYAWSSFVQCALYSNFGGLSKALVATPFRSNANW